MNLKKIFDSEKYVGQYKVVDCEHQGDIDSAKREVIRAGGLVDGISHELKDYKTGDYYEDRTWFIDFHCDSFESFDLVCEKLGIYNEYKNKSKSKRKEDEIKELINSLEIGDKFKNRFDETEVIVDIYSCKLYDGTNSKQTFYTKVEGSKSGNVYKRERLDIDFEIKKGWIKLL